MLSGIASTIFFLACIIAFDLETKKEADPSAELTYILQHKHTDKRAQQRLISIINRRHPSAHFWTPYDPRSTRIDWNKVGKLDPQRKRLPSYAATLTAKQLALRPRATPDEISAISKKAHKESLKRAQNVFGNALNDLKIHVGLPNSARAVISKGTNHQLRTRAKTTQSILRYIRDQALQHPTPTDT